MTTTFAIALFGALILTFAAGMALGVSLTFGRPWRNRTIAVEIMSNGRAEKALQNERKAAAALEVRRSEGRPERRREGRSDRGYERISNIAYRGMTRMAMATRLARTVHSKDSAVGTR